MKKRLFSTLLMGAFFIASMSMFTSCKDYDDDLNNHESQIKNLQEQIANLKSANESAKSDLTAAKADFNNAINNLKNELTTLINGKPTTDWVQSAITSAVSAGTKDMATTAWVQTWVNDATKDLASKSDVEQAQNSLKLWVNDQKYITTDGLDKALAALESVYAKADKVAQLESAIAGFQAALDGKASTSELQELANKVAQIDPKLDAIGGRIDGVKKTAEDAAEAVKTANASIAEQIKVINEVKAALQGKATTTEVGNLATQLKSLTDALDERLKALEQPGNPIGDFSAAINALDGRITALEALPATLEAIQAQISGKTTIDEVQVLINQAETTLRSEIAAVSGAAFTQTQISVLQFLVEKGLTSIVLKPAYYLGGIEAIDLPMVVRQPEIFLNPNTTSWLDPALKNAKDAYDYDGNKDVALYDRPSNANNYVRGDEYEEWVNVKGRNYTDSEAIHWPDGLQNFLVGKLASYSDTYSYYREKDPALFDGNFAYNLYRYVDIVPNGHAYYHINPSTASLEGQTLRFFCNYPYMTLVTRDAVNEPKNLLYAAKANMEMMYNEEGRWVEGANHNPNFDLAKDCVYDPATGILDVPFYLNLQNYLNSYARNFIQAFDCANGFGDATIGDKSGLYGGNSTYADGSSFVLNGSADGSGFDTGLNEISVKLPFVAAQITGEADGENRTVTSDYAIVTPSFLQLLALADANADLNIATSWTHIDHSDVAQNHLYRTPQEAIDGEATHQLVYNDKVGINMDEFMQTHVYRFGTKFCRDEALTPALFEELGLRYEYTLVDWYSAKYVDSQSAHARLIGKTAGRETGNTIVAANVDVNTGATLETQSISSVGREPIVRVMLVHKDMLGKDHILLKGYVKFRIVKELEKPIYAKIELNANNEPVFMDCANNWYPSQPFYAPYSGLAFATWHQMERIILDNEGVAMPKADFDNKYMLELNPARGNGAKRYIRYKFYGDADSLFYDEETFLKRLEEKYKTGGLTLEEVVKTNYAFAIEYFKAFAGNVYYSGFEGLPGEMGDAYSWKEFTSDPRYNQQNVLYWKLGSWNSNTAHSYETTSWSAFAAENVDNKYLQFIAGVNEGGISTKDVYTYVKFIPRGGQSGNPIFVKLTIPAGKLIWAAGNLANHKRDYWFDFNKESQPTLAQLESKKKGAHVYEVHFNPMIQNKDYNTLLENDYIMDMSKLFMGVQYTNIVGQSGKDSENKAYFPGLTGDDTGLAQKTNIRQRNIAFYFTTPQVAKDNADFDADFVTDAQKFDARANLDTFRYSNNGLTHAIKVWQTRGHSGKKYTLALAIRNDEGKLQTWQVNKKLDTQEVRDYTSYIYAKVLDPNAAVEIIDDVKSLYGKVESVTRGTAIVAIREVGYDLPSDLSGAFGNNSKYNGYNPMYEIIYKEPVLVCELLNSIRTASDGADLAYNEQRWGGSEAQKQKSEASYENHQNNDYFKYACNAIAEDILNAQEATYKWENGEVKSITTAGYKNYNQSAFGPHENLTWEHQQGAFTAYVETVVNDVDNCATCWYGNGCYELFDPNNSRFFNIRVNRPVYIAGGVVERTDEDAMNNEVVIRASFGFTDWRNYNLRNGAGADDNKDPNKLAAYYQIETDQAYYGKTNAIWSSDGKKHNYINFTRNLLDEIRTDVHTDDNVIYTEYTKADGTILEYRTPYDVNSLKGRIAINALPVASDYAFNRSSATANAHLELSNQTGASMPYPSAGGSDKLYFRNTLSHTNAFNLYIPAYYSYVFGNGELFDKVVPTTIDAIYGNHYIGGYSAGYPKFKNAGSESLPRGDQYDNTNAGPYVWFKERIWDVERGVYNNYQDWIVVQIPRTKNH